MARYSRLESLEIIHDSDRRVRCVDEKGESTPTMSVRDGNLNQFKTFVGLLEVRNKKKSNCSSIN